MNNDEIKEYIDSLGLATTYYTNAVEATRIAEQVDGEIRVLIIGNRVRQSVAHHDEFGSLFLVTSSYFWEFSEFPNIATYDYVRIDVLEQLIVAQYPETVQGHNGSLVLDTLQLEFRSIGRAGVLVKAFGKNLEQLKKYQLDLMKLV